MQTFQKIDILSVSFCESRVTLAQKVQKRKKGEICSEFRWIWKYWGVRFSVQCALNVLSRDAAASTITADLSRV